MPILYARINDKRFFKVRCWCQWPYLLCLLSKSSCILNPWFHASLDFPLGVIPIPLSFNYTLCHLYPHQQLETFPRPRNMHTYLLSSNTFSQECCLCSAARRPAGGASQDKIQPVFCCPSHASTHVGLCLLRVKFSSFSEGPVESSSSFILNPFPSCYNHLSLAYTIWIPGSFMPVYPFHSFSLCSLISVPSTPLKQLSPQFLRKL